MTFVLSKYRRLRPNWHFSYDGLVEMLFFAENSRNKSLFRARKRDLKITWEIWLRRESLHIESNVSILFLLRYRCDLDGGFLTRHSFNVHTGSLIQYCSSSTYFFYHSHPSKPYNSVRTVAEIFFKNPTADTTSLWDTDNSPSRLVDYNKHNTQNCVRRDNQCPIS